MRKIVLFVIISSIFFACEIQDSEINGGTEQPKDLVHPESASVEINGNLVSFDWFYFFKRYDTLIFSFTRNLDLSHSTADKLEIIGFQVVTPQLVGEFKFATDTSDYNSDKYMIYNNTLVNQTEYGYFPWLALEDSTSVVPKFTIVNFNLQNNSVSGSFQGHLFLRDSNYTLIDDVVLTKGVFDIHIY